MLFVLGNELSCFRIETTNRVTKKPTKQFKSALYVGKTPQSSGDAGRSLERYFRIMAGDDRVRVMAVVRPPPYCRPSKQHETCEVIDRVIEPARVEGGSMPHLMPPRIARSSVKS
jgi:hypothetical protein